MSATTPTAGERDAYLLYTHVLGIQSPGRGRRRRPQSLQDNRLPGRPQARRLRDRRILCDVALELHHGTAN